MDYLKKIRELKGLSNEDIAELADVPETTVSKIISGATQDPHPVLYRRLRLFQILNHY